jgi:hypothetical protein
MDPNTGAALPPGSQRKTSPWVYVGCGCAVLVVIVVAVFLFIAKKVADEGHKIAQGIEDPKVREQRTRELLGYTEPPAGYYPEGAFSIPFVLDMAFLGDRPPAPGPHDGGQMSDFQDNFFMYMRMRLGKIGASDAERRRMLYGTNGGPAPWQQGSGLSVSTSESLGDGETEGGGAHVMYRAMRGETAMRNHRHHGISSILLIVCPDRRIRFGVWIGPDPAPDKPAAEIDKTGTPADPKAIAAFLDHFKLCSGE